MAVRTFLFCCALGLSAWAAEESAPGDEQAAAEEQETDAIETADVTEDEDSETPDGESPDTFIPSEDISENIAVKFPVDI